MHAMSHWRGTLRRSSRSQLVLSGLLIVALLPAASLAYLQYRSLSTLRKQTRQAVLDTLKQGLIGARLKAQTDFEEWPRMALLGDDYHDWLEQGDSARLHHLSEFTRRVCPHLSLFFAYQLNAHGETPKVWLFRPSPVVRFMNRSDRDPAEAAIREIVSRVVFKTHFSTYYTDIGGERHQVFIHFADYHSTNEETKARHGKAIGYYGFAIPTRALADNYFPKLLREHLPRLATLLPADTEMSAWVVNEAGDVVGSKQSLPPDSFVVEEPIAIDNGVLPGWRIRAGITGTNLERAKSEFVASVSHELKTPIALIRGYMEILHSNRLRTPEEREDYFRIAESEAMRLSGMVDGILESSKIEAGIKSYSLELVDVAAVVEETLAHFTYELDKAGVSLSRERMEPNLLARVDSESLARAVLNLLSNAVKYSGSDRHITLRVRRQGGLIAVSVSDRGIGISKDEQVRIFQRFYRISAGGHGGAGLGLALVKHFAEAHGGTVTVESDPGSGSTFTILLPSLSEPLVEARA